MFKKIIKFARSEHAFPPKRKHDTDAGFDLSVIEDVVITEKPKTIFCDIQLALPKNMFALVLPRSSISQMGIQIATGVIDNGYRGYIGITAYSVCGDKKLYEGERLAQLVPLMMPFTEMQEVEKINPFTTQRGKGGFGSTGR